MVVMAKFTVHGALLLFPGTWRRVTPATLLVTLPELLAAMQR
jgi:hypothetical protein